VYTYSLGHHWESLNLAASIGAAVLTIGILISVWNFWRSLQFGATAGKNPWAADGLEWAAESPPAPFNLLELPIVTTRHPLWDDYDEARDVNGSRLLDGQRVTFSTTGLDAEPIALAKMPEDTITPLFTALALTAVFACLLAKALIPASFAILATLLGIACWLWPAPEKSVATPHEPLVSAIDDGRGRLGMGLFIATEATLFAMLFFSYFYLGPFPNEPAPKLKEALIMLAILLSSSVVMEITELFHRRGRALLARSGLAFTILLGLVFLAVQVDEYRHHLKTLSPRTSAYGSIFYAITGFHSAHVVVGLCLLLFALVAPELGPSRKPPHGVLQNVSRYWHFVDVIWLIVVLVLYVAPRWAR